MQRYTAASGNMQCYAALCPSSADAAADPIVLRRLSHAYDIKIREEEPDAEQKVLSPKSRPRRAEKKLGGFSFHIPDFSGLDRSFAMEPRPAPGQR
ncbi:MAG: hypothetical protein VB085_11745 [Peptococcaceae bacterium]|nr:hypothetical protein [Peptococcaceae bacterium]